MASLERQALYRGGRQLSLVLFVDRAEVSLRGNMEALPCIDAGIGLALNEMADVVQQGGDNGRIRGPVRNRQVGGLERVFELRYLLAKVLIHPVIGERFLATLPAEPNRIPENESDDRADGAHRYEARREIWIHHEQQPGDQLRPSLLLLAVHEQHETDTAGEQ